MGNATGLGDIARGVWTPTTEADDFDSSDLGDRIQVFLSKGPLADHDDSHEIRGLARGQRFSSTISPAAVLEAGT